VDTAPALAEGTAGVELAGKAERAITAKPEALEPWVYGGAGRQGETPPQEHEREIDALPPEGRRKPKALPGKRKLEVGVPPKQGQTRAWGQGAAKQRAQTRGAEQNAPPRREQKMALTI